jgi:hypothetical protein
MASRASSSRVGLAIAAVMGIAVLYLIARLALLGQLGNPAARVALLIAGQGGLHPRARKAFQLAARRRPDGARDRREADGDRTNADGRVCA